MRQPPADAWYRPGPHPRPAGSGGGLRISV